MSTEAKRSFIALFTSMRAAPFDNIPMQEYSFVMNLRELKSLLRAHPAATPRFLLPDGDAIPAHFHITEVGHVAKRFVNCGGTVHDSLETCLLQTYVAGDLEHRLDGATFTKILDLGKAVLPGDDLEVEVEYDCCVTAQYPIASAQASREHLDFQLEARHTDCLATEKCGIESGCCGDGDGAEAKAATATAGCCC